MVRYTVYILYNKNEGVRKTLRVRLSGQCDSAPARQSRRKQLKLGDADTLFHPAYHTTYYTHRMGNYIAKTEKIKILSVDAGNAEKHEN